MIAIHPLNQQSSPIDTLTHWHDVSVRVGYTFINSMTATHHQESMIELDTPRHISLDLFEHYVNAAMKRATLTKDNDDAAYFSDIPDFPGVWASHENPKECLDTLDEVLRDWIILKIKDRDTDIPVLEEIDLSRI